MGSEGNGPTIGNLTQEYFLELIGRMGNTSSAVASMLEALKPNSSGSHKPRRTRVTIRSNRRYLFIN